MAFAGIGESFSGTELSTSEIVIFTSLSCITTTAASAYGTFEAAKEFKQNGSYLMSWLGATGGLITGCGLGLGTGYFLEKIFVGWPWGWSVITFGLVGTSLGAVIGYNLSIPKEESRFESGYGFLHRHFDLPSFTMKTEKTQEGKTITAFDFRLINARF